MNMTHATDEHPVDQSENEHEDVHHAPDEAHVQRLMQDGPQGPQGRVAMAAAGIDVDGQFPVDAADQHPDETAGETTGETAGETTETTEAGADSIDEGSAEAYAEEDPSRFEDPDNVAVATPANPAAPPAPTSAVELLPADGKHEFLSRWNTIQIGFVEDPAQSVRDADALIEDISAAYVSAIAERRDALNATWQNDAGTEEMRRAVLQYRSLLSVILPG